MILTLFFPLKLCFLYAAFPDLLEGPSKKPRCWTVTEPSRRRRGDGGCSLLQSAGANTCGVPRLSHPPSPSPPPPTPSPPPPPPLTGHTPQPAAARAGAHPHHARPHPLRPLLTRGPSETAIRKKHTVKSTGRTDRWMINTFHWLQRYISMPHFFSDIPFILRLFGVHRADGLHKGSFRKRCMRNAAVRRRRRPSSWSCSSCSSSEGPSEANDYGICFCFF